MAGYEQVDWRTEVGTAVLITAYVTLLGGLAGVIWHAVAPVIDPQGAISGSDAVSKLLLGDDMWLALVGIVAGVLCVAALVAVAPGALDGPGAQVGLVVGGCLAMIVADRVGHLIGVPGLATAARAAFPDASAKGIGYVVGVYDFKARATGVLLTWPFASLLTSGGIAWLRALNRPTARPLPAYPGSP